ncbi:MAG: response regulator [Magnetococcus sp. YQC-5]
MHEDSTRPCILIVDDLSENLDVLKSVLEDDYAVRAAMNGPLALRLAAMHPKPDLILLDIIMPDMDGHEVCRQLKRDIRTQDIPVIFVTSKSDVKDELNGLQMGAVDYITKPISPPIVQTRIKMHLALRNLNQDMEEKNSRLYEINERLTDSMEQLLASEDRFRSLVQTIPDIVYKINEEGHFTFLNKSIERLGYHQSDLIGKHFSEIIYSADIKEASLQDVLERITKGITNPNQKVFDERRTGLRMSVGLEIRLKPKTGIDNTIYEIKDIDHHLVNVEVNSTGLYGDVGNETSYRTRQYIGTVGVIRDITDRLKIHNSFMEERKLLRQLIDAVPLPIFFFESQNKLIFSNDAFQEFMGCNDNILEGISLDELFCIEDQPKVNALIKGLRKSKNDRIHQEMELISCDNHKLAFDVILLKFNRSAETIPAVIGILVDITEQKAFTIELIQAKKYAEEMTNKAILASQAKGDFLANMSHEIRTPLNGVIGLTHLCLQTELTGQQKDYLVKASLSANILLQLINDILDFSKIEAGKLAMENVEFTLDEVLSGLVTILSVKSQEKGLELLLDTKKNVPYCLKGDSHRLGQILTNLLGNAIKFTKEGEVSIIVEVLEETQKSVFLQFTVRDTGIGMTPEQVSNLFQEFSQGDASITRKYGGTGLGLAISKRLVEMMGGQISVENDSGCGSRFKFTTRFDRVDLPSMERPMPAEAIRGLRILVVDDNDGARQILAAHLDFLTYPPVCVESGEMAFEALIAAEAAGFSFDMVLLDWKMPGINGMEAARRIRKDWSVEKNLLIIMMTAYGQEYLESSEAEKNLLNGFLMKPINLTSLLDVIMIAFGYDSVRETHRNTYSQRANLSGTRLLLAEDNEINQQVARELLEQVGIEVVIANNGQEVLDLVEKNHFDAILMDLQMPIMDGLIATRCIRQTKSAEILPIIAMTANAMNGDREICLKVGMNDHIAKPVEPDKMYAILAKWVQTKSSLISQTSIISSSGKRQGLIFPIPPLPGIDIIKGLRNVGGNTILYRNVLLKFARNQAGACLEMERCLTSGDLVKLENIAHGLKGVSATLGILRLADLAGKIEKQSQIAEGLGELPEWLGITANELMRIVLDIESNLMQPTPVAMADEHCIDATSEELNPLFHKCVARLLAFDTSASKMVEKIASLSHSQSRQKRVIAIKKALGAYDFETCLSLFYAWAQEEGIDLQDQSRTN